MTNLFNLIYWTMYSDRIKREVKERKVESE